MFASLRQERMLAALEEAGFAEAAAYSFHQDWRIANADHYIESILTCTVLSEPLAHL